MPIPAKWSSAVRYGAGKALDALKPVTDLIPEELMLPIDYIGHKLHGLKLKYMLGADSGKYPIIPLRDSPLLAETHYIPPSVRNGLPDVITDADREAMREFPTIFPPEVIDYMSTPHGVRQIRDNPHILYDNKNVLSAAEELGNRIYRKSPIQLNYLDNLDMTGSVLKHEISEADNITSGNPLLTALHPYISAQHASPNVLIDESNHLVNLGNQRITDIFKTMRSETGELEALTHAGVPYGESVIQHSPELASRIRREYELWPSLKRRVGRAINERNPLPLITTPGNAELMAFLEEALKDEGLIAALSKPIRTGIGS